MYRKIVLLFLVSLSSFTSFAGDYLRILYSHIAICENFVKTVFDFKHSQEKIQRDFEMIFNELSRGDLGKMDILDRESTMLCHDSLRKFYLIYNSYFQLLYEAYPLLKAGPDCSIENFKSKVEAFFSQALLDIDTFFREESNKVIILKPLLIDLLASLQGNKKQVLQTLWQKVHIEALSEENFQILQQELKNFQVFIKTKLMIVDSKPSATDFIALINDESFLRNTLFAGSSSIGDYFFSLP